jgi:CHAT domain-containing protein
MGDDALSGLARAFFFAGARSLLVSHWSVGDDSAQRLIVETLRLDRMSGDRAESLRLAMKAMLNDRSSPAFAHPSAWAPFMLVGETRR